MNEHVTVTGAGGYIGRHVVRALNSRGVPVTAVSRRDLGSTFADLDMVSTLVADVLSPSAAVDKELSASTALVHLAWEDGFVLASPKHALRLSAHYRFLAHAAELGVHRIAPAGTMHEIGYWEGAIDETTPSRPQNLYGIAKAALRDLLMASADLSSSELLWLRFHYILGDDENNNSIFSKILAAESSGQEKFPFTSGRNLYDFIEVEHLAEQIASAILQNRVSGIIDCCSGDPQSLGSRVEEFLAQHGLALQLDYGAYPDRQFDSPGLWGDSTKIRQIMSETMDSTGERE